MQVLSDIVTQYAKQTPSAPALLLGDQVITWAELAQQMWKLANALRQIARPGDRVAVFADNSLEAVYCYYGVPAAGMIVTYVNYRSAAPEYIRMLQDAEPTVLVIDEKFEQAAAEIQKAVPSITAVVVVGGADRAASYRNFVSQEPDVSTGDPAKVDDVAWIVYTSGTTGAPKGVMLTHLNIMAAIERMAGMDVYVANQLHLFCWPLFHVAGIAVPGNHYSGSPVVLMKGFDPEGWMQAIDTYEVVSTSLAPAMLAMVLQHPNLAKYRMAVLRAVVLGGSAVPKQLFQGGVARFGEALMVAGYGLSEGTGTILSYKASDFDRMRAGEDKLFAAAGRPYSESEIRLVDEHGKDCQSDELGEIIIKSDQVSIGYWRNPEPTAESFKDGWFWTGDLAKRDSEGLVYIIDRKDDILRSGSEKVSSVEVENALRTNPDVLDVAVIGVPDEKWGQRITAIAVKRPGSTIDGAQVIQGLRGVLAGYKLPKQVVFVESLPRNANGKILKRQLRDQYSEPSKH